MKFLLATTHKIALQGLVLAAGQSLRFKTGTPKLTEKLCGQPIVLYPINLLVNLDIPTTIVVGHEKETITRIIQNALPTPLHPTFITQEEQHGTAHAVACTQGIWDKEHVLVINGDMPLVRAELITALYEKHLQEDAAASFVVVHNPDPTLDNYSLVIAQDDQIEFIHSKDCITHEQCCIDAGIYIFKTSLLRSWLAATESMTTDLFCNDIVEYASQQDLTIASLTTSFDIVREVNTPQDLWVAHHIKRAEIIRYWMNHGVIFNMPHTVHIDLDVKIGAGTRIGSGVHLYGSTEIGMDCSVGEFSIIEDSTLKNRVTVHSHTVITKATIDNECSVGPFAHIRPATSLAEHVTIGNFVEVTRSSIGRDTKAKHLTYIGDAHVGFKVNIGAGSITCNHDGFNKHPTTIKNEAYVGSNSIMVAPVTIGEKAITAAGSVITEDVPANALALGRARQINKLDYAQKIRERAQQTHTAVHQESAPSAAAIGTTPTAPSVSDTV
jgi:bifunctional UDP-N-acetylglucosamine pyrophosphorylase/glucosamine-1-phosphate N-acetyltransferase